MLTRQRVLLQLLREADRSVLRIELVKWCFLLRFESVFQGGPSFYDFVPFERGPYSFTMRHELDRLAREGWIESDSESWRLSDSGAANEFVPPGALRTSIRQLVVARKGVSVEDLLDHVYRRHTHFTMNSLADRLAPRPTAQPAIFTSGYEGETVDAFLNRLITAGIRRLIDVRHNPTARRYGFHRSTLNTLCHRLGIEYQHRPELGITSSRRQGLDEVGQRERLLDWYDRDHLARSGKAVDSLASAVAETPSVLVCMEARPCECHRSRLAERLAVRTGLRIIHLQSGKSAP
jgi:uncharacterized protein (DUF488 family)